GRPPCGAYLGGNHPDSCVSPRAWLTPNHDFDILVESGKKAQQSNGGKLSESPPQQFGHLGLVDVQELRGLDLRNPALLCDCGDMLSESRLDQGLLDIRIAEIDKDLATPRFDRNRVVHHTYSF